MGKQAYSRQARRSLDIFEVTSFENNFMKRNIITGVLVVGALLAGWIVYGTYASVKEPSSGTQEAIDETKQHLEDLERLQNESESSQ